MKNLNNNIWHVGLTSYDLFKDLSCTAHYQPTVSSSNDWAKETLLSTKSSVPHLFFTDHQTTGHGRKGRVWIDEKPGSSLLSTWAFQLKKQPQPIFTILVGLATFVSLEMTWPWLPWSLKAPNDIYIGEKKVGGLLTEIISQGDFHMSLIGFGFNVWSSPKQFQSTSLVENLNREESNDLQQNPLSDFLTQSIWKFFLRRLFQEYCFLSESNSQALSTYHQKSLLHALNKHPLLIEKYTHIDPSGSLHTQSQKIDWMDL